MDFLTNWTWGQTASGEALTGPEAFSWFHFLWIGIAIVASGLMCRFVATKHNKRTDDIVILTIEGILLISEVIKQFFWYHVYGYFRMDTFPFQFCSVPLYVGLTGALVRNEKVKDLCYKFVAFYGAIGGIAFMVQPSTLHTYWPFISLQSMCWHAMLITMACYLIVSRGYGKNFRKDLLDALIVFVVCVVLAVFMNELVYYGYIKDLHIYFPGRVDAFPMFFISRHYPTLIPGLDIIQKACPYLVFVLSYVAAFFGCSCFLWFVVRCIRRMTQKKVLLIHK